MKKTSYSGRKKNMFQKKGFFIALYSCLGVVATLAIVVTITTQNQNDEYAHEHMATYEVAGNREESYLIQSEAQWETPWEAAEEEAWFRPRQQDPVPPANATPGEEPPPEAAPSTREDAPPIEETPAAPESQPATPPAADAEETTAPVPSDPQPTPETPQATPEAPQAEAYFTPFADGSTMLWPVYGETLMPFSVTSMVYDPTLDQFRTNDNIRINAELGDMVRASACGRVLYTGQSARYGNYIVIDHGNGWHATYGQLMETMLVEPGQVVEAGQNIGAVGHPSVFGASHGNHVHFRLQLNMEAVNPYYVLAGRPIY